MMWTRAISVRQEIAPRRSGRLRMLLLLGVLTIAAAAVFRSSPWAREYPLRRASLEVLKSWATETPNDALLQYYLGTQYHNAGIEPEALAAFQRAAAIDPKMHRAYTGIAAVRLKLGQNADAHDAAKRAVALAPRSADARFLLGLTTYPQSKTQALLEFRKLTELAPKDPEAWHWRGLCSKELNDYAGALEPLQRAVALTPRNGVYRRDLGAVLMDLGRFDKARTELERAVVLVPNDSEAIYLLARNLSTSPGSDADLETAVKLMGLSLELLGKQDARNRAAIMVEQADVLRQLKRPAEAYSVLQRARELDPTNTRIFHFLGLTARAQGHDDEADRWLSTYARINQQQTELRNMEQRVKQDSRNPSLRVRLARLYERAGNLPFAVNQYDVCLSMDPNNPQARREREALMARLKRLGAKQGAASR